MDIDNEAYWYHRHHPTATKDDAAGHAKDHYGPTYVSRFLRAWATQRKNAIGKAIKKDVESFRSQNPSANYRNAISYARGKYESEEEVNAFCSIFRSMKPPSITQLLKDVERNWPEKDEDEPEKDEGD